MNSAACNACRTPMLVVGLLVCCWNCPRAVLGYTPESPEVKAMVQKAVGYLEQASGREVGYKSLIGFALLKAGKDLNHPKIQEAVAAARKAAADPAEALGHEGSIYGIAVAAIFLAELDPVQFRPEIVALLNVILKRQQPGGGWSYPSHPTGDTSQVQYAVLGLWTAHRAGIETPVGAAERVCLWLLRTQDPSGGFVYQGNDPGPGNLQRINQGGGMSLSLTAAGLGAVYVCADLLGLTSGSNLQDENGLPPALQEVKQDGPVRKGPRTRNVNQAALDRVMADGDRWMEQNYRIEDGNWNMYYLYSLERYHSFRELARGQDIAEPKWYNDGVAFLAKTQGAGGNWEGTSGVEAATAFGVLFLLRSTKRSLSKVADEGLLIGGRGLPSNTSQVRLKEGQVVGGPVSGTVDELLELLDDPDNPDLDLEELSQGLTLSDDPATRRQQVERLRRLTSGPAFHGRLVAVRVLGRTGDLDNVPVLIYALSDPDWRVVKEARDGLRFISRKFRGFGLPDRPERQQVREARGQWEQWYQSIRPDVELLTQPF